MRPGAQSRAKLALLAVAAVVGGLGAIGGCSNPKPKPRPAAPAKPAPAPAPTPPLAVKPLCAVETAASLDRPPKDRVYPPQNWFVLLLQGYRSNSEMARPVTTARAWP